ncbi:hypothetical protein E7Z59_03345 [Robertkochia marina]|uniref:Outer membrane protein beta-barrel domain-containing protein n=1 Tax=Robertkochia marina TaxID=1227945 RepID=A0A4S3M3P1_9FLAO|nr:outer membrane beta-barrel protein [Robertkochia marina]THD69375.1 hypothetical protein E7Z59_03345 [Robertkochia marina]TRZ47365.1 hypothetical protein D3A96_01240 [Robertkochia marina]
MKEEKDLERLYRERFKDFEVSPARDLWTGIEDQLDASENRKTIPLFWKRAMGVAALLGVAFFGARSFLNTPNQNPENNTIITASPLQQTSSPDKQIKDETSIQISSTPEALRKAIATSPQEAPSSEGSIRDRNQSKGSQNRLNQRETVNPEGSTQSFTYGYTSEIYLASTPIVLYQDYAFTTGIMPANHPDLSQESPSLLDLASNDEEKINEDAAGNWVVYPAVAPVYYGSLNNGSPIEPGLSDHSKSGETHLSYGVNVAYHLNKKLSLRTGVNRVTMGYTTNDVSYTPTASPAARVGNIDYASSNLNIIINDLGRRPQNAFLPDVPKANLRYNGDMAQRLGYVEVPLELKYKMVGNKIGLHLIGGLSSLFLVDNSIMLQSETLNTELGTATNVNSLNFSTNLGVGVDYRFSDALLFNLEPMFKYQWNTFSGDTGGFSPYLLGVYTGFSFRF